MSSSDEDGDANEIENGNGNNITNGDNIAGGGGGTAVYHSGGSRKSEKDGVKKLSIPMLSLAAGGVVILPLIPESVSHDGKELDTTPLQSHHKHLPLPGIEISPPDGSKSGQPSICWVASEDGGKPDDGVKAMDIAAVESKESKEISYSREVVGLGQQIDTSLPPENRQDVIVAAGQEII